MTNKMLIVFVIIFLGFWSLLIPVMADIAPAGGTNYYIDSQTGDDGQSGTQPKHAWKSLAKVNQMRFVPGDRIQFKAGTRYAGGLCPQGSGREGQPIRMGVYGEGGRPRIDGGGVGATLLLHNVEYWEVRGLELTNQGKARAPRNGVKVTLEDFGTAHHIQLRDLYIHDVNGTNVKADGGGAGISWNNWGNRVKSRFDGLLIEGCHLVRTDRNGICGGGYGDRTQWYPSLNVVIRGNRIEDFGGDGIVSIGTDGCLIERNVLRQGRQRANDAACGIWPFSCDNTVIQYNEVSGMRLEVGNDGQAFDADYNCRNTVFQYNYSHDNAGGFFMICNWAKPGSREDCGNDGIIFRYNISQNDGTPNAKTEGNLFLFVGPFKNAQIYNNVICLTRPMGTILLLNTWVTELGAPDTVSFRNNIFYVSPETKAGWMVGGSRNVTFENNIFWGTHITPPKGFTGIIANPMLANPGSGKAGLASLAGYQLKNGSPCFGAGQFIPNNGGLDFWGNPLPSAVGGRPAIGAYEPVCP